MPLKADRVRAERCQSERPKPGPPEHSVAVVVSSRNPFREEARPGFPNIQSPHGNFSVTTIDGNQVITDVSHRTADLSSGSITTTTIASSGNDTSVRT